ncbi:hypothetical protein [Variovorax sp. Root473]|uniref:hypothetical protein n=1 Tax=Variovorax sp. Root473 TaxID=1736541 RepID=UPI0006F382B1|nr:hypothetical protein [Variovorax sp. Root473]KQX86903.1 hypothetical protein ASD34_11225 [Variovorax sp. Root473]
MSTFTTTSEPEACVAEERPSTLDDHVEDRLKSACQLEREQCHGMRRVAEATGTSAFELRQLTQRLSDIDRCGAGTCIVAQGHVEADRMASGLHADAALCIDLRLLEPLGPAHDKKWFARWKFWSFLLGAAGPVAALTLQGLALRPSAPRDAHADLVARSRKVLESWRRTCDTLFWHAVEDYVRQQAFSLETQAYLMHCVAAVFAADTPQLSDARREQLAAMLTDTYCDALGAAATMPSSDIYRRLAQGLEIDSDNAGPGRPLGRGEAAQVAMTTLFMAVGNGGSR